MKSGAIRVSHHSPFYHYAIRIIGAIIVVITGFGLFYYGQFSAGYNIAESTETQGRLSESVTQLEQDKVVLRDQLALVERSTQVDAQAYFQVKDNLKSLQQEILELREEVSFYRGIVAPKESSSGLRIEKMEISKASGKRLYHYNLVLTQVLKNHKNVSGSATLVIEGVQNDRPKKLKLKAVSVSKRKLLKFKFKYFQKLEGDLLLPEGFIPRQVKVEVSPRKRKKVQGIFDWPTNKNKDVKSVAKSKAETDVKP